MGDNAIKRLRSAVASTVAAPSGLALRGSLMVTVLALILATALATPTSANAGSVYVAVLGSDEVGSGDMGSPYGSIQKAMQMAGSGDQVIVGPGTFRGAVLLKDGVVLRGSGSSSTVLSMSGPGAVVSAVGIGQGEAISGVGVMNDYQTTDDLDITYGIRCVGSSPEIRDVAIAGAFFGMSFESSSSPIVSSARISGVVNGVACRDGSSPIVSDSVLDGGSTGSDGVLCVFNSAPVVTRSHVRGFRCGVNCEWESSPVVHNSLIACGSGVQCGNGSSPVVVNNTILFAEGDCGVDAYFGARPTITNCIIWGPGPGQALDGCSATYSVFPLAKGLGNVAQPPNFVDEAGGDYHLRSDSVCVDAATSTAAPPDDLDGVERPRGIAPDIGAYEYPSPVYYSLAYSVGEGGRLMGPASQNVRLGLDGEQVFAVPGAQHHFVCWSDGCLSNPRVDLKVSSDISVTAVFAVDTYQVSYASGGHGYIQGETSQTLVWGQCTTTVTAVPDVGYHFAYWSDGKKEAARADGSCSATYTANFVPEVFRLTYTAVGAGVIEGTTTQFVTYGSSGSTVTAVPAANWAFSRWSDGVLTRSRVETSVVATKTACAIFVPVYSTAVTLSGPSSVARGNTYWLKGTVTPSGAGGRVRIVFKRYVSGAYRQVGVTKYATIAGGRFVCGYKPSYAGKWRVYVSYPGQTTSSRIFRAAPTAYRAFVVN